jgi:hypothetical protein
MLELSSRQQYLLVSVLLAVNALILFLRTAH